MPPNPILEFKTERLRLQLNFADDANPGSDHNTYPLTLQTYDAHVAYYLLDGMPTHLAVIPLKRTNDDITRYKVVHVPTGFVITRGPGWHTLPHAKMFLKGLVVLPDADFANLTTRADFTRFHKTFARDIALISYHVTDSSDYGLIE